MNLTYFNPRDLSLETLEKLTVGREGLVQEILESLRQQRASRAHQHWLIRGSLGAGKSHLCALLYHRIRAELAADYLLIWLPEAEHLRMGSDVSGWMNSILRQLLREGQAQRAPIPSWLEGEWKELPRILESEERFERGLALLRDAHREIGRKLVLLQENFDQVLQRLRKKTDERRFREVLLHEGGLLLLATVPRQALPLDDPDHALYQHLRRRELLPLSAEQVGELLRRLGEVTGEPEAAEKLGGTLEQRKTTRALTGGTPRLVVMLFDALCGPTGVESTYAGLKRMLDQQTRYFEARLEQLSHQDQEILGAFCEADENLSATEVSRRLGTPTNQVSVFLRRLVDVGVLEPIGEIRSRDNLYGVADDLLRIWYQYRFGAGEVVIRRLVLFLGLWYRRDELEGLLAWGQGRLREPELPLLKRQEIEGVLAHVREAMRMQAEGLRPAWEEPLWGFVDRILDGNVATEDFVLLGQQLSLESLLDRPDLLEHWGERIRRREAGEEGLLLAQILKFFASLKGQALSLDDLNGIRANFIEPLRGNPVLYWLVFWIVSLVLFGKGYQEHMLSWLVELRQTLSKEPAENRMMYSFFLSLTPVFIQDALSREEQLEWIDEGTRALEAHGEDSRLSFLLAISRFHAAYIQRKTEPDDAILRYQDALNRLETLIEGPMGALLRTASLPIIPAALLDLATLLKERGDVAEARLIADRLLAGYESEPAAAAQVSSAMWLKGRLLMQERWYEQAAAVYGAAVDRFIEGPGLNILFEATLSFRLEMFLIGEEFVERPGEHLTRRSQQLVRAHSLLRGFNTEDQVKAAKYLLNAHCYLAWALFRSERSDEALAQYDLALSVYSSGGLEPPAAEKVQVLVGKGLVLVAAGRPEEALSLFRECGHLRPATGWLQILLAVAQRDQTQDSSARLAWGSFLTLDWEEKPPRPLKLEELVSHFLLSGLGSTPDKVSQFRADLDAVLAHPQATGLNLDGLRPLRFVADYFDALAQPQQGKYTPRQRAERVLDQVPRELREAIEEMVRTVEAKSSG